MSDYGDNKSLMQSSLIRLICLYKLIQKKPVCHGGPCIFDGLCILLNKPPWYQHIFRECFAIFLMDCVSYYNRPPPPNSISTFSGKDLPYFLTDCVSYYNRRP